MDSKILLLHYLIPCTLRQVSLGQHITEASRSTSAKCSIVFWIGVQIEKTMGSKWLVNHVLRLRYSISSDEVPRYRPTQAAENTGKSFIQWVADNVDHILQTQEKKHFMEWV